MKFAIFVLCVLPIVLSAPNKRFFIDSLTGGSTFDLTTLKCDLQIMIDVVGSAPTEKVCEGECHNLLQEGHVLNYGCPLVCNGFQALVHTWHLVPETTDPSVNPCQTLGKPTTSV